MVLSIQGPAGSPYEGHTYTIEIRYPTIRFLTPIFHPNVCPNGQMSSLLFHLYPLYSQDILLKQLEEQLHHLMESPQREYPYNEEAAALWETDPIAFRAKVSSFYFANIQGNVVNTETSNKPSLDI
jgi:ubiquitin-protein ligase